jgi:hypothetical protein
MCNTATSPAARGVRGVSPRRTPSEAARFRRRSPLPLQKPATEGHSFPVLACFSHRSTHFSRARSAARFRRRSPLPLQKPATEGHSFLVLACFSHRSTRFSRARSAARFRRRRTLLPRARFAHAPPTPSLSRVSRRSPVQPPPVPRSCRSLGGLFALASLAPAPVTHWHMLCAKLHVVSSRRNAGSAVHLRVELAVS